MNEEWLNSTPSIEMNAPSPLLASFITLQPRAVDDSVIFNGNYILSVDETRYLKCMNFAERPCVRRFG